MPDNDSLTRELYKFFLEDLKTPLISNFKSAIDKGELSSSHKQMLIKLIEIKNKKLYIKDLEIRDQYIYKNVDLKILPKALANCIKKYLIFLISSNQTAYVEAIFVSEGGRLFSDILQVTDFLKLRVNSNSEGI